MSSILCCTLADGVGPSWLAKQPQRKALVYSQVFFQFAALLCACVAIYTGMNESDVPVPWVTVRIRQVAVTKGFEAAANPYNGDWRVNLRLVCNVSAEPIWTPNKTVERWRFNSAKPTCQSFGEISDFIYSNLDNFLAGPDSFGEEVGLRPGEAHLCPVKGDPTCTPLQEKGSHLLRDDVRGASMSVYMRRDVPPDDDCSRGCPNNQLADGICQPECNVSSCWYDLSDCLPSCAPYCPVFFQGSKETIDYLRTLLFLSSRASVELSAPLWSSRQLCTAENVRKTRVSCE